MAVKTEPGLQACVASKSTTCISGAFCFMESSDFQVSNPEVIVFSQERASGSDGRGICLAVDSAQKLAMCSFLVPVQERNQRKRPVGGVEAKSIDAASIFQHNPPTPSHPPPGPPFRLGRKSAVVGPILAEYVQT